MTRPSDSHVVADIPRRWAARDGDRTALVEGDRACSYRELDRASNRVAQALIAEGLEPGARVALLGVDSIEVYEALFGCAKARLVALGVNWRLATREIEYILTDAETRLLFVDRQRLPRAEELVARSPRPLTLVVFDEAPSSGVAYAAWRDRAGGEDPGLPGQAEEVVVQMYTSGTTGHPKGVMLANRSFFAVVDAMRRHGDDWIGFGPDDVSLLPLPTFHIGGLWWALTGLCAGARQVIMPSFVGADMLRLIEEQRVTKVCMVPAMMQVALGEPEAETADLSSLDHVVYGGSPIPRALMERAIDRFGCAFAQIYGLTETGNTAVCLRPADHHDLDAERMKAAGRPYPGVRLKCIDRDGRTLGPREIGEICIDSPANMVGYWRRDEATAETLVEGWIHTGDAGFLDEDGYVYVQDRVKDMIIYAGENVYPAEIESVLCDHPGVVEAAVIGIPDERWGETVKAIVVRGGEAAVTARALLAHARAGLAEFKVPRSVEFVDALPRTVSGKIRKSELRRPYWEGRDRQVN